MHYSGATRAFRSVQRLMTSAELLARVSDMANLTSPAWRAHSEFFSGWGGREGDIISSLVRCAGVCGSRGNG